MKFQLYKKTLWTIVGLVLMIGIWISQALNRYFRQLVITRDHGHFTPAVKLASFCTTHTHEGPTRRRIDGRPSEKETKTERLQSTSRLFTADIYQANGKKGYWPKSKIFQVERLLLKRKSDKVSA